MNKLKMPALSILGVSILFLLAAGCGGGTATQQSENSIAFDSVKLPAYSGYTAVSVTHSVNDYHEWLKVYVDVSDPNSRISIYTSPDDPNLITVFELTKSHDDAKKSFGSDEMKKAMKDAGVTSQPVFQFYDIKYKSSSATEKRYRLGVTHAVADYDTWKREFDKDEPIRAKAGLELRAISTNADDSDIVNVMFATDNVDKAKGLINSNDLKKRMSEGGVRSEPKLTVLKVPNL
ncbi:hypothetical protein BH10BAC4_BH10BAC4_20860 [soil metagenome]